MLPILNAQHRSARPVPVRRQACVSLLIEINERSELLENLQRPSPYWINTVDHLGFTVVSLWHPCASTIYLTPALRSMPSATTVNLVYNQMTTNGKSNVNR